MQIREDDFEEREGLSVRKSATIAGKRSLRRQRTIQSERMQHEAISERERRASTIGRQ